MNGLDLFSGIGGISLALEEWVRPVIYCESDPYCQGVLLSRMRSGNLSRAPIWDDVRTLKAELLPGDIGIIYGGFPCQDISVAGTGRGLEGERSGLFFEIARLAKEIKPAFIFLENVPAIRTRGGEAVGKELAALGYDCRWDVISAAEIGAPHLRKRWFLLAYAERFNLWQQQQWGPGGRAGQLSPQGQAEPGNDGAEKSLADTSGKRRLQGHSNSRGRRARKVSPQERARFANNGRWWAIEPDVGRVVDGLRHRVDRIRGLGNSVVPLQAQVAFKRLMGL